VRLPESLDFVTAAALFPYYSPALIRTFAESPANAAVAASGADSAETAATRVFQIEGMTCTACAATLEVRLAKLPGVVEVRVSFDDGSATIRSAPNTLSADVVRALVEEAGFKIARP